MVIWAFAATAAAVVMGLMLALYRRQVRKICRQMEFLKDNRTNLRITSDLPLSELNELIDGINDILDRSRKRQEHMLQNETQLKETITNLSHDIRTPLTSLDGYFQLLQQDGTEEERLRHIGIIQSRILSLKEMLEELFTYARLQDIDYQLELERIDVGKCVYDTVFSFYEEFQKKGIEPKADFSNGHFFIQGNEEALRRALQNLLKNALVHGHTEIVMRLFCEGGKVVFLCSNDTACPEEIDMEQVFQRFYKADSSRTHTSAGLGLSIAKGLVKRMGGEIFAKLDGRVFQVWIEFEIS